MARIGIFPGTFDPPSQGHLDIIQRAKLICDHLIVTIAHKPDKKAHSVFTVEERSEMLRLITHSIEGVEIAHFQGLIADYAREKRAAFLVRGLRAFSDFEHEFQMALANRRMSGIETIFLMADERHTQISSTLIREIAHFGGPLHLFVPPEIEPIIRKKFS